jgi:hypothetical protein
LVFEFYNDDWDDLDPDESTGLLGGWGNDELDRILAGSGDQPRGKKPMSYGSRGARRKSVGASKGGETDPTIVPNSSMFGFLERLPWKIGARGTRYKPSAADLQENPGKKVRNSESAVEDSENEVEQVARGHGRNRSGTTSSKSTTNSLSSRGDLFPSEDEDDAVPLDDEFSMALERRNTNQDSEDANSGKTRKSRQRRSRTASSKTTSSKGSRGTKQIRSPASGIAGTDEDALEIVLPSMDELHRQEQQAQDDETAEVQRKHDEAQVIAVERGLPVDDEPRSNPASTATVHVEAIFPLPDVTTQPLDMQDDEAISATTNAEEHQPP